MGLICPACGEGWAPEHRCAGWANVGGMLFPRDEVRKLLADPAPEPPSPVAEAIADIFSFHAEEMRKVDRLLAELADPSPSMAELDPRFRSRPWRP